MLFCSESMFSITLTSLKYRPLMLTMVFCFFICQLSGKNCIMVSQQENDQGSISSTFWRKAQMRQESFFGTRRHHSVLPTKLSPTSSLRPTRKYTQLLCFTPALSNQNVLVATFATKVATESLLSPQLRYMQQKLQIIRLSYYKSASGKSSCRHI